MQSLARILVGTDFSGAADDALAGARLLAGTFGSEVCLAHAVPALSDAGEGYEAVSRRVEERLERIAAELASEGVRVAPRPIVRSGSAADVILTAERSVQADLVVLGAGRKSTLERVLLGSTAERVVRESERPVWLTPPGERRAQVRRIVCAVDGSAPAREALTTSMFLARTFVAHLDLLTVFPAGERPADGPGAAVRDRMEALDMHAIDVEPVVREGRPADEIVAAVTELGSDLLVLGSAGRTGFSRLLHGNTAEKVARLVSCPLLAVRPPSA